MLERGAASPGIGEAFDATMFADPMKIDAPQCRRPG
jgi:hypothetical protein